jgi:hypothetical protein
MSIEVEMGWIIFSLPIVVESEVLSFGLVFFFLGRYAKQSVS